MFRPQIVIQLDAHLLRQSLDQLRTEMDREPQRYSEDHIRREQARCALKAITVKRTWYGPPACEDCQYFHGRFGINCALHPSGPPDPACSDWNGPPRPPEGSFFYVEGEGWTLQNYQPGQGWTTLRTAIPAAEVSASLALDEFYR
ncbi:hypothetical protein [Anthocerotibacter panamensis]|uniref:hypothetical protein n=1 Tax=Anthocerotibacter panamensis TaxID=2857077 RepID=UPI001C403465|nr:hypothetical protein [Anthocerotibacter panamensis]